MPTREPLCCYCLKPIVNTQKFLQDSSDKKICFHLVHNPDKMNFNCSTCKDEIDITKMKHEFFRGKIYHPSCCPKKNPLEFDPNGVNMPLFLTSGMGLIGSISGAVGSAPASASGVGAVAPAAFIATLAPEVAILASSVLPAFGDKGKEMAGKVQQGAIMVQQGAQLASDVQRTGKFSPQQIGQAAQMASQVTGKQLPLSAEQAQKIAQMAQSGQYKPEEIASMIQNPENCFGTVKEKATEAATAAKEKSMAVATAAKDKSIAVATAAKDKSVAAAGAIKDVIAKQLTNLLKKVTPDRDYFTKKQFDQLLEKSAALKKAYNILPEVIQKAYFNLMKFVIDRIGFMIETGNKTFGSLISKIGGLYGGTPAKNPSGKRNCEEKLQEAWEKLTLDDRKIVFQSLLKKDYNNESWGQLTPKDKDEISKFVGIDITKAKVKKQGKGLYHEINLLPEEVFEKDSMILTDGQRTTFTSLPSTGGILLSIGRLKKTIQDMIKDGFKYEEARRVAKTSTWRMLIPKDGLEIEENGHIKGKLSSEVKDLISQSGGKLPLVHLKGDFYELSGKHNPSTEQITGVEQYDKQLKEHVKKADDIGLALTPKQLERQFERIGVPKGIWETLIERVKFLSGNRHGIEA